MKIKMLSAQQPGAFSRGENNGLEADRGEKLLHNIGLYVLVDLWCMDFISLKKRNQWKWVQRDDCAGEWPRSGAQGRAAKPDNLSSIPRSHMVQRENWLLQVVICPLQ